MKFKKLMTNTRIIILIVALLLAALAIQPSFHEGGVVIRSVVKNSSAALATPAIESPGPNVQPMQRELIKTINNVQIKTLDDYYTYVATLEPGQDVYIRTNKDYYTLTVKPIYNITVTNETEYINKTVYNATTNTTQNITVAQPKINKTIIGTQDLGLNVQPRPKNNIRKGLDLEGGTRVLLQPAAPIDDATLDLVISNIKQRLNVYGISDIVVRPVKDLDGNVFISVEIAGVNKDEVRQLLASQGKFEAKIGNETVFVGGKENGVASVCKTADCSGLDSQRGCGQDSTGQWVCGFRFAITLSPEAAKKQAAATDKLNVVMDSTGEGYLSQNLSLYLDDALVDELRISSSLKGSTTTQISISGSGSGASRQAAIEDTLANMKKLQTVLVTGSLPVKLNMVKTDAISPALGKTFLKNIMLVGLLAFAAVISVVLIRYRQWKVSIPMIITLLSEVILILGFAALIRWRLDLAGIAGIIIAVGTGVDDQIVIADETFKKEKRVLLSWKEKLKRAFFIIMASYVTTVVAMLPLWFAGAGLLKGFALTTILGVSIGVFITRPAYATVLDFLVNK